jgi:hypothetical protein
VRQVAQRPLPMFLHRRLADSDNDYITHGYLIVDNGQ